MRLLLDTCALLWLEFEIAAVPPSVLSTLKSPEIALFASAVNGWEIAIKQNLRRFPQYTGDVVALVHASCMLNRIEILPVTWQHGARAGALPLHHRDPFDRMLVAQAQVEGCVLVSPDDAFRPYDVKMLWG